MTWFKRKQARPRRLTTPPTRTWDQKREWRADYVNAWNAAHFGLPAKDRGHWRPGDKTGRDYWITNTPEWDVKWFHAQGWYLPHPWRLLDAIETARIECGDGLNQIGVAE